jgi:DNA polymerase
VVQATARDLLVEAILRLEALGLPVLFHVHDEVVCEVPDDRADWGQETLERELCRTPEWALGLPIACEVKIAERYGK